MTDLKRRRLLREVSLTGMCTHPVRLTGEALNVVTGEVIPRQFRVACKDRRQSVCTACADRYETDAWIIVAAGMNGGKGVPDSVASAPRVFVTVTAPSFGAVHRIHDRGVCVAHNGLDEFCPHGLPRWCSARHKKLDLEVGSPLCEECFDAPGVILWNAHASKLWSITVQEARRNLAETIGISRKHLGEVAQLHYVKVAELQQRGLVHFHALFRFDTDRIGSVEDVVLALQGAISTAVVREGHGVYRWGRVFDVQDLGGSIGDARSVASYLAKYVTKTAGGSLELASRFHNRRQIASRVSDSLLQRLALEAWDMGLERSANTLGYAGQFITKSRGYSTSFGKLRSARAAYWKSERDTEEVIVSYVYGGRGYDDPRASELADVMARLERDCRIQVRRELKERREDA